MKEKYIAATVEDFQYAGPTTMSKISEILQQQASQLGRPRKKADEPVSHAERRWKAVAARATAMKEQRCSSLGEVWRLRGAVAMESVVDMCMRTLGDLRAGGWGARHMRGRPAGMPIHKTGFGYATHIVDIQAHAQEYCSSLFAAPPPQHGEEEQQLEVELGRIQIDHKAGASLCLAGVQAARQSMKPNKVYGRDDSGRNCAGDAGGGVALGDRIQHQIRNENGDPFWQTQSWRARYGTDSM